VIVIGQDKLVQKLKHALDNSSTVVIASVMEDKLPSYNEPLNEVSEASKGVFSLETTMRNAWHHAVVYSGHLTSS